MEILKNSLHTVRITGYTSEGAGVARLDGLVVFVAGGAEGDLAEIRVLKTGKNAVYARIERLIEPSPARMQNDCPVFPVCGGCDFRHISYEEELRLKKRRVDDAMRRIGGFNLECEGIVAADKIYGYRNKAVYPVGLAAGRPAAGFYRERSHDIVPTKRCLLQAPEADAAASAVLLYMEKLGVPPYDERTGGGAVRHVFVRTGEATGETLVCVVSAVEKLPAEKELVRLVLEACPSAAGIVINHNSGRGNAVLGPSCRTIYGRGYIYDELCGLRFAISPLSFYQVNRRQAERLYALAAEYAGLGGRGTLLDLYCGAGTITLALARSAEKAWGVEIVPQAVEDAKENARLNGVENTEFLCADAAGAAAELSARGVRPDVVTVDPPRKGLDPALIDTVADMKPERVVYVSCDPATLARDARLFAARGYAPARLRAVDMFPRTSHCEVVVKIEHA